MSGFLQKSGTQLTLNGKPFRVVGSNPYDLCTPNRHTWEIDDQLAVCHEMGATLLRIPTIGESLNATTEISPTLNTFNPSAFILRDYVIWRASQYGMLVTTDFVGNFPPGTYTFGTQTGSRFLWSQWEGQSNSNTFWTDAKTITDVQMYISYILNHVNIYTGIAYKNDPTIACWELGGELDPAAATSGWTNLMAAYVKSIDPNHLVMDGGYGPGHWDLTTQYTDLLSEHFYPNAQHGGLPNPLTVSILQADAAIAVGAGKILIIGEQDWNIGLGGTYPNHPTLEEIQAFHMAVLTTPGVGGDMYWADLSHRHDYGYRDPGNPGFLSMHYPTGESQDTMMRIQLYRQHAFAMQGRSVPADSIPLTPLITNINSGGAHNILKVRGSAPSSTYTIRRRAVGDNRWQVAATGLTDNSFPWTDTGISSGNHLYQVCGFNLSNVPGPYSPIASSGSQDTYLGQDTFRGRTQLNNTFGSWDYSSDGQLWNGISGASSTTTTFGVFSGSGTISTIPPNVPTVIMKLGSHTGNDMEGYVRWSLNNIADSVQIFLRLVDSTHFYRLSILGTSLTIDKRSGGALTTLATSSVSVVPTPGNHYWFHFKVVGTTLSGKMWPDKSPEPASWMVTSTDSSVASGGIGLGAIPTTTTPVTFDHYLTTAPQNTLPVAHVSVKVRH